MTPGTRREKDEPGGVILLGVCGGTGSGKTTVTRAIVERVGGDRVAVVPHDAYYRDYDSLPRAELDRKNFDHPEALDTDRLIQDLKRLKSGKTTETPVYDFRTHRRATGTRRVEPRKVILVDGILIFAEKPLRELFDIKIYVDTDADIRLIRRLRRDIADRGRSVESVLAQYEATVRPMHLEFVEPSKRYADIIIPEGGQNDVALDFVMARMEQLLAT